MLAAHTFLVLLKKSSGNFDGRPVEGPNCRGIRRVTAGLNHPGRIPLTDIFHTSASSGVRCAGGSGQPLLPTGDDCDDGKLISRSISERKPDRGDHGRLRPKCQKKARIPADRVNTTQPPIVIRRRMNWSLIAWRCALVSRIGESEMRNQPVTTRTPPPNNLR